MLLFAMLACENPISNELFEADETFLVALPGTGRTGFPANLRALPVADDPLLVATRSAAERLEPLLARVNHVGETLRSTSPDERSPTHRTFAARPITLPERLDPFYVRADLVRADADSEVVWSIDAATDQEGPWETIARGVHEPDGSGTATWHDGLIASVSGTSSDYDDLTIAYDDPGPAEQRAVELTFAVGLGLPEAYSFEGDEAFGFFGVVDLGSVGPLPSFIATWSASDGRGRAEGIQLLDEAERPFVVCWDATGARVFAEGEGIEATGSAASCTL